MEPNDSCSATPRARAGVPATEIAYVGDRLDNDVFPAQELGIHAVFIRRGPWGYLHASWPDASRVAHRVDEELLPHGKAHRQGVEEGSQERVSATPVTREWMFQVDQQPAHHEIGHHSLPAG